MVQILGTDPAADLPEEDGLELDPEDGTAIKRPFNPQKIKIHSTPLLVGQMLLRMKHREIVTPEFQRASGIWNQQRQSRLVESLLLRIPIPAFYFAADSEDNWAVVDGLQRTTTIRDFAAGKFPLKGLEYLTIYEGKHYADLPRPMQRRIEETSLMVNVIQHGTPEEVTFNIFSRINTGGIPLSGQEIRHALHKGPVLDFLKQLAESPAFLDATGKSVQSNRMADRECVLRFLAFRDQRWKQYSARDDLDRWLSNSMKDINDMSDADRTGIGEMFDRSMLLSHEIFGKFAFRKWYGCSNSQRLRPINKALFEIWSTGLSAVLDQRNQLLHCRDSLISNFHRLMNQPEFEAAVSTGTATMAKVHRRFGAVEDLIRRYTR